MATFPYSPAKVLSSPASNDILYTFQPGSSTYQLLSLNSSVTLDNTNLPYSTISSTLPFLDGARGNAFTAAMDDGGNILVYTGACGDGASASTLWQFSPNNDGLDNNGTWKEHDLSLKRLNDNSGLAGANYLASAIVFSTTANSSSEMYVFGGMCPGSTASTADNWIQTANYSNTMLVIESAKSSDFPTSSYELSISSGRGPPIAEAGFSITPLQPTFFGSGKSTDAQSRNQNFVLLGGHTQQAFINMSQVALFSLPEQSWTFLPIGLSLQEPNTELAARKHAAVDSRSGHTAFLTSDGKRVVVFGGWVGDTTTSANPQLAVLELGEGYGGSGDWQWSIPSQTGPGLTAGTGIYGHGVTMLAGDVMMVVGGYQIPTSGSSNGKRTNLSMSSSIYYLNTTSMSWITSYTHPKVKKGLAKSDGSKAGENAANNKIGLGVGLVFGLLAFIAIAAFYFWYRRRLKRQRDAHEDDLRQLANSTNRLDLSGSRRSGRGPSDEMSAVDWAGTTHASSRDEGLHAHNRGEPEAERTGLLFEIPSPTRGLRRSLHSRGIYQPTSRYEEGRRAAGFSTIHPIDERDEYDEVRIDGRASGQNEMLQREDYNILSNVPVLDPFQDLIGSSRTPSPQSPHERELEIRNWVSDWTAADAMMHSQVGRLSPEKTDRTSSTLSDQSARSGLSSYSIPQSVGSISRSISQRSAALFSATPFRSTNDATPINVQRSASKRYSPEHRRAQSLTLHHNPQRTGTFDSPTATTSFTQLQAEGEALLGNYPGSAEPSPTRSQSRARGWMGSVRRAFTGTERGASMLPENNRGTSSPATKLNYTEGGIPRRAASTGAMLWQKRKGARDWDPDGEEREAERTGANAEDDNDEEWDVESAVERRVVQVMFTVPKEKLRVVNRGPDGDGDSMMSAEVKEAGDGGEATEKGKGKEHG